jgi:Phytanoyl-CoA dioxygenase (PhyH)
LQRDGFVVLGELLSAEECDELTAFALATPGSLIPAPVSGPALAQFDPNAPMAVKCDIPEGRLSQHPIVQRLLADTSLRELARRYLRCEPVNDLLAMWWSAPAPGQASSEAAQLYHFDMDRPQFLKVFFYLTDVTVDTGPHCYIRASHRDRPAALWRDGRHDDHAILTQHGSARAVEICGARGTGLAVDTSGFHKGKPLKTGHRLILQLEYTCALFGQSYQNLRVPPNDFWREQISMFPRYYARFALIGEADA